MNKLDRIKELVIQLGNLGYFPYQIQEIIKDTIETTRLDNITQEEAEELIENLEDYIQFAIKCHQAKL